MIQPGEGRGGGGGARWKARGKGTAYDTEYITENGNLDYLMHTTQASSPKH